MSNDAVAHFAARFQCLDYDDDKVPRGGGNELVDGCNRVEGIERDWVKQGLGIGEANADEHGWVTTEGIE